MPEPKIYTTVEWGARKVSKKFLRSAAEGIVIHNTQSPNRAPESGSAEEQTAFEVCRGIQVHHMDHNGWSDSGQNFTVSRGGLILEGRTGSLAAAKSGRVVQGAHASGVSKYNDKWFGIELEGIYLYEYAVTNQQWRAVVELCAWLVYWGKLDSLKSIIGHMDVLAGHTDCPGLVERHLASLRAQVHDRVGQLPDGLKEDGIQEQSIELGFADRAASGAKQLNEAASSTTEDGRGASKTSGLFGTQDGNSIDATEKLEAIREGKSLGPSRIVRQVRIATSEKILVHQSGYGWAKRVIPDAVLLLDSPGFPGGQFDMTGEVSYFGKFDPVDEGTGAPIFGTVQTDSSVFGVALPKKTLLKFGLAEGSGKHFHATAKGLQALIEVYYPKTRRLVRAPIVDIGPAAYTKRPTDLTVAAAAFLQDKPEETAKGYHLPNIQAQIRVA